MSRVEVNVTIPELDAYIKKVHGKARALTPAESKVLTREAQAQLRVIKLNWPVNTGASRAAWRVRVKGRPGAIGLQFSNRMHYASYITPRGVTPVKDGGEPWFKTLLTEVTKTNKPRLIRLMREAIDKTELALAGGGTTRTVGQQRVQLPTRAARARQARAGDTGLLQLVQRAFS